MYIYIYMLYIYIYVKYMLYICIYIYMILRTVAQHWCWFDAQSKLKILSLDFQYLNILFSKNKCFRLWYYNTDFCSFRWLCWWGCWNSRKLWRKQIWCLLPSVSYIRSHTFHEWWRSFLNYHKNYIWCAQFKGQLLIYMLII